MCCLPGYHPWLDDVSMNSLQHHIHAHHVQPLLSVSADCPSLTWVALSIPITTCVSLVSKQPWLKAPLPIPPSLSATELPSSGALDPPLRVFTEALLAAFESSQPGLKAQRRKSNCSRRAGITGETLRKKKKSWCEFKRHEDGAQSLKSLPQCQASSLRFTYLFVIFCHYHF